MTLLVTGCAGYVGHQVAIRLAQLGHTVLGSSRRPVDLPQLHAAGVELVIGDHGDPGFVDSMVSRVDAVLHFAARTRGHTPDVFRRDNEEVTSRFAEAANRLGKRLVFISSDQAVYQTGHYGRSKRACEELVTAIGGDAAVVRLSAVVGRHAPDMASTFSKIVARLDRAPFLVVPGDCRFPIAPVWIGDIATVLDALLRPPTVPPEPLELCGEVITLRQLLDRFEQRLGVSRLRLPLPIRPLQACARWLKPYAMFARLPLDALLDLGAPVRVSHERLTELLRFHPTPMAEAVDLIEGFPLRHGS